MHREGASRNARHFPCVETDTSKAHESMSLNEPECKDERMRNCSCHAYMSDAEAEARANCITWYENLMDVRRHVRRFPSWGLDLYVRVDVIELEMGTSASALKYTMGHNLVGIHKWPMWVVRWPGYTLDTGLSLINGDADVLKMLGTLGITEVGDIGDENATGVEEGARMECDLSDADSEDSNYVASEEDNDEVRDDDSWMYEDLEDVNIDEKWYSVLEENLSLKGSSDEEGDRHPEFKEKIHMANPILVEGMKFTGARQFREFLKEWNVVNGYDIEYKKNESTRITTVCRYGCTWRIHASPIMRTTTFQIKSIIEEHEGGRQYDNRPANSSYIGKKLLDEIKDNPTINITSFKNKIRRKIMNGQTSNATSQPMGTRTDVPPTIGTRTGAGRGATGREANGKGMTTSTGRGANGRGMTTSVGRGATGRVVTTVRTGRGRGAGSSQPPIGSSSQLVGRSTGRGVTGRGRRGWIYTTSNWFIITTNWKSLIDIRGVVANG
ncbi:hypothetical protein RHSIM_Rhsim11G0080600 [Rhododendron simsii]|uniref:Transposase MuDR plant domain-containing protein n=1 Tax=Rhododendron simsii TaxID=118357 RepID=A0A834LB77_RHOSS|nr:hypothetical protein RHSIM_Rhsim11G0080600 [Rhododendron simsii]